jgi:hypothetical protein
MLPRYLMPHCKQCALTTINTEYITENQEYQIEIARLIHFFQLLNDRTKPQ